MPTPDLVDEICVWKTIMNKRFTSLMTTLILSVFFAISASAYDVEVDGIYYNIVEKTKKAEVTFGDTKPEGDIVIPSIIKIENDDYDVTSIGYKAFSGCYYIKSVTIPSSVTYIDSQAFWHCNELSYLSLSKTIIKLGDQVFEYCKNLSKVEIPDISVWMSIDFNGTVNNPLWYGADLYINGEKLTNLIVPEDIISIKDFSFQGCNSVEKVVLHNGINLIGQDSFNRCKNLKEINIPESITQICSGAFYRCKSLIEITIPHSISLLSNNVFSGCESLTSIIVPNTVNIIGDYVFSGCSSLTQITIGQNTQKISNGAFSECKNLNIVTCLSENIPSTFENAFENSYIEYATLHVPASAINAYKTTAPWSGFGTFKTLEGTEVETKKCETPIISFVDGKLTFSCETEDVEYVSEVKCSDASKYYTNEVSLAACYDISVTAMKKGYDNSDVATAKLYWLPSSGTLEGDNINNVAMRGIAIQSAGGFINISGLDNNEKVDFYGVDGKTLGSVKSIDGSVSFSAKQGSVVVAKIGKESVKIAVE